MGDCKIGRKETKRAKKKENKKSIGNIKEGEQHLERSEEGHLQTAATNQMPKLAKVSFVSKLSRK